MTFDGLENVHVCTDVDSIQKIFIYFVILFIIVYCMNSISLKTSIKHGVQFYLKKSFLSGSKCDKSVSPSKSLFCEP